MIAQVTKNTVFLQRMCLAELCDPKQERLPVCNKSAQPLRAAAVKEVSESQKTCVRRFLARLYPVSHQGRPWVSWARRSLGVRAPTLHPLAHSKMHWNRNAENRTSAYEWK